MCGICGFVQMRADSKVDANTLGSMMDQLAHRGPDDHGSYVDPEVALGFRRLSIVDISGGHQPMTNEDQNIWLTFNGEIYNHLDLKASLEKSGHNYQTRSDTESIVHLFEEKGLDCFSELSGMFAIALWDKTNERFVLARDRLGIKPVYYFSNENVFIYSSEIKAILKHPEVRAQLRPECLSEVLSYRYVSGENTLFAGIKMLLPGHFLTIEKGTLKIQQYWDVKIDEIDSTATVANSTQELAEQLSRATKDRLMSDVALGTLCSGGVDSSLTTALAVEHGMSEINTFSVGFNEKEYDETKYARIVSKRYSTNHHELVISGEDFAASLPTLIWHNDEPLNHPNSVQIFKVSELARSFVTVLLTGEGADELFGGYPRYQIPKITNRLNSLPSPFKNLLGQVLGGTNNHKLNKLAASLNLSKEALLLENSRFCSAPLVNSVIKKELSQDDSTYRKLLLQTASSMSDNWFQQLFYLEIKTYLVSILHRMDKMTMAAKVEGRVPFLDHKIVEWAAQLPLSTKMPGFKNKLIVKKLAEQKLPREIIYRQKSGFGVPLDDWFRNPKQLGRYLPMLSSGIGETSDYLDQSSVENIIQNHLEGKSNNGELLWMLVNLELWHRIYISGANPMELSEIYS